MAGRPSRTITSLVLSISLLGLSLSTEKNKKNLFGTKLGRKPQKGVRRESSDLSLDVYLPIDRSNRGILFHGISLLH